MHNAREQHFHFSAIALHRHVAFDRFEFWTAGPRNKRKQPLADAVESKHTWRVYIAQDADHAGVLLVQADNDLRLDGAITQPRHDGLLNVWQCTTGGRNLAGVRNIYVALLIDSLRRQIDKVAGTGTCSGRRREEATGRGFEDRHIQDVADTGDLLRLGPLVVKLALEGDHVWLGQKADRIRADIDQRIRQRIG